MRTKELKLDLYLLYIKKLTTNIPSTKYIKEKWESEFNTKISDDDWQDVENTSDIHQFTHMEGILLGKFDPFFNHVQGRKKIFEHEFTMLERMWSN